MAIRSPPAKGRSKFVQLTIDRAIELARQRFAELKGVADWSMRADYEMVELLASRKRLSQRVRQDRTTEPLAAHQEFV